MIKELIQKGAIFVCNHSGGKDSQAMYLFLRDIVPEDQLIVIHAHLPGADWEGIDDHIKSTTNSYYEVVRAKKTFFEMVRHRGMWPSPQQRQCTSDLKRGPIEKAIRHYTYASGNKLIVSCEGKRAEESPARAKEQPFRFDKKNSKAGREWYTWLPIQNLKTDEVFSRIKNAGEKPHWAYSEGMTRLSCSFCIMASKADLQTAARLKPSLFEEYCELEQQIDHTLLMPDKKKGRRFLPEVILN